MKYTLCLISLVLLLSGCSKPKQDAVDADAQNFATATRAFYLWRCGMPVSADYNGQHYAKGPCHLHDGLGEYIECPGDTIDGTGGWHDAGDYGKYTVNAAVTLGTLFYAWQHFGDSIAAVDLDIPDTAPGMPQFLQELKWETDFLLKMQYPDGSGRVSHKLTPKDYAGFVMPEDDHAPRYFSDCSTAAIADFAASMAMAARAFAPYDSTYAQQCLDAARLSYEFLVAFPEDIPFEQADFATSEYLTSDPDDRLWAAAEMWETTGDPAILDDLESRISMINGPLVQNNWDWGNVSNLGVWTYVLSQREGRNPELLSRARQAVLDDAQSIADRIQCDQYGCPLSDYFWGSNGMAARNAVNLHVAEIISDADYADSRRKIADWLLGNNAYGRSFVTGLGVNPPMHPHDRRSAADGIEAPWPGYLVSGGLTPSDWVDEEADSTRNGFSINAQAGLVYLLGSRIGD